MEHDENENVLELRLDEGGAEIIIEDGHIYFADNNACVEISEEPEAVYYDEHDGFILPDGRSINDITIA